MSLGSPLHSGWLLKGSSNPSTGLDDGILNASDVIDRTAELKQAADKADGWRLLAEGPNYTFYDF